MSRFLITAIVLAAVAVFVFGPGLVPGGALGDHALRFLVVVYVLVPLGLVATRAALPGAPGPLRSPPGGIGARIALGLAAHSAVLALAFLPVTLDAAFRSIPVAVALAPVGLALSVVAWWGLCAPECSRWRLPEPAAMAQLFLMGIPHQLTFGPMAVAGRALYDGVSLADQRAGALVAWVPGGLLLWVAITLVWIRWARRERAQGTGDDEAPPLSLPKDRG